MAAEVARQRPQAQRNAGAARPVPVGGKVEVVWSTGRDAEVCSPELLDLSAWFIFVELKDSSRSESNDSSVQAWRLVGEKVSSVKGRLKSRSCVSLRSYSAATMRSR